GAHEEHKLVSAHREARRDAARPGPFRRAAPLPAERTRLIGRRRELEEIEHLVLENEVRLLVLTGAGGTGKTRLALRAAAALEPSFPGGTIYVPLAPITDADLVADSIALTMGTVVGARPALASVV